MSYKLTIRFILVLLGTFLITSLISAQDSTTKGTISQRKFDRLLKKRNTVLIGVRTAEEFKEGHLQGAENIDVKQEDFKKRIASLDKSKRYLLYCGSGKRSLTARNIMKENGFGRVYDLKGGIEAWKGEVVNN
jgi:rhodanese-related sulfurtransferase